MPLQQMSSRSETGLKNTMSSLKKPLLQRGLLAAALALCTAMAWAAPAIDRSSQEPPMAASTVGLVRVATCPPPVQMPTQAELQALAQNLKDRGLLWRVGHGGRSSWLYGTMHVAKREWMLPGRSIMQAMAGVDKLALELNVMDPEVGKALAQGLKARDDAPELAAALAARLELQRQQACAPELAGLRPEAQVLGLLAMAGRSHGLDAQYGVDMMLAGMASGMRKPVLGLETVQAQLDELVSDDPAKIEDAVNDGLKQLESGTAPEQMQQLAELWADGNEQKLESYADWCDCANTPRERAQLKRLLDDRNAGMADGIVRLLQEGQSVFAAVGALHMVGPQGLPTLLRQKGYQVERVKFTPPAPKAIPPKTQSKPMITQ